MECFRGCCPKLDRDNMPALAASLFLDLLTEIQFVNSTTSLFQPTNYLDFLNK